jgi:phenylpropionate dioxygenase-like ring-hydroxylating dioxygenase large terminal subunit
VFPNAECLYLMIDVKLVDSEPGTPRSTPETSDDDDDADDDTSGGGMTEVRFVPDDKSKLQIMFNSMSHCQSLHPDAEAEEDQADEEDAEEFEGNEDEAGDDGVYDDADEDGEPTNGSSPMEES